MVHSEILTYIDYPQQDGNTFFTYHSFSRKHPILTQQLKNLQMEGPCRKEKGAVGASQSPRNARDI